MQEVIYRAVVLKDQLSHFGKPNKIYANKGDIISIVSESNVCIAFKDGCTNGFPIFKKELRKINR